MSRTVADGDATASPVRNVPRRSMTAITPGEVDAAIVTALGEKLHRRFEGQELSDYLVHLRRYALSFSFIPDGEGRLIDMGSSLGEGVGAFTEFVCERLHYAIESETPGYDFERDRAPYPSDTFDGVLLMEVLEHFAVDPMFALAEINRILKPGGFLFLTTPNIASWRALREIAEYRAPYVYGVFTRSASTNRHNREYTAHEVAHAVTAAGFEVQRLEAINVYEVSESAQPIAGLRTEHRGDTTFCLCRKSGPMRDRYPSWLYV